LSKKPAISIAGAAAAPAKPVNTDPATCDIDPNKNITIEINTENKPLGVFVVGGKDTLVTVRIKLYLFVSQKRQSGFQLQTGVVVVDVNVGSPAANDKRLQALDQILQINDVKFNAEMKGMHIHRVFKQCAPKVK
jgi:PDZ domain